jgi:hypothetical protein
MPPKGKVKVPEAVTLVVGPLDGSTPIDFGPLLAALASDDSKQHESVADTVGLLPCSEGIQVGLRHIITANWNAVLAAAATSTLALSPFLPVSERS